MYYCGELPILLMVGIMTLYRIIFQVLAMYIYIVCLLINTVWREPFEGEKFRKLVENGILRRKSLWIACLSTEPSNNHSSKVSHYNTVMLLYSIFCFKVFI